MSGIRKATVDDIPALLRIENASFTEDLFTRRQFYHLLTRGRAVTLLATGDGNEPCGYATVLFHRGVSPARLYSMAVAPAARGRGVGRELLAAAEEAARARGAAYMRLEVRVDNRSAQRLYRRFGYRRFGLIPDYYEDGADALRMERCLAPQLDPSLSRVPPYAQTRAFTCGPAALLMAMRALDPTVAMTPTMELRIWRETTTIYMSSGHGGCGPYGMALYAHRRGFDVELHVSQRGVFFADSVRSPAKREVMRLVQEDFRAQLRETPVRVTYRQIGIAALEARFRAGGVPIVLVSSYRLTRGKEPHWVVVTGFAGRFVFVHDPDVGSSPEKTPTDCMQVPILREEFGRMARYGRVRLQAALVLRRRQELRCRIT